MSVWRTPFRMMGRRAACGGLPRRGGGVPGPPRCSPSPSDRSKNGATNHSQNDTVNDGVCVIT